jgi:hypothetical protein
MLEDELVSLSLAIPEGRLRLFERIGKERKVRRN